MRGQEARRPQMRTIVLVVVLCICVVLASPAALPDCTPVCLPQNAPYSTVMCEAGTILPVSVLGDRLSLHFVLLISHLVILPFARPGGERDAVRVAKPQPARGAV